MENANVNEKIIIHNLNNYNQIVDKVLSKLNIKTDTELYFDLKLILIEALMNAYEHGNKENPGKSIILSYSFCNDKIRIEVEDMGEGLENVIVPDNLPDSDLLNICGRGLFLINCVADKVELKKNSIVIEKFVEKSEVLK